MITAFPGLPESGILETPRSTSGGVMAARSKEATSKLHEKHQVILANLLREDENKYCADCHAKGPRWASWNLGVFVCIRCAGIHRNLGVHVSRVKSVNLDAWTPEQIESIQRGGNGKAKEIYEANLPDNFRRPQDDYAVEVFIRSKYERKQYVSKGKPTASSETAAKDAKSKKDFLAVDRTDRKFSLAPSGKEDLTFLPRPASTPNLRSASSTSPKSRPRGIGKSVTPPVRSTSPVNGAIPRPLPPAAKPKPSARVGDLMITVDGPGASGSSLANPNRMDLLTGLPLSSQATSQASAEPSIGSGQKSQVKDTIMSLYSTPQQASYTAHGMPVNAYYYQQQQAAAIHMAQAQAQQRYQQVQQVQQQMQQLKARQQQATPIGGTGGGGGQTLNPTLW